MDDARDPKVACLSDRFSGCSALARVATDNNTTIIPRAAVVVLVPFKVAQCQFFSWCNPPPIVDRQYVVCACVCLRAYVFVLHFVLQHRLCIGDRGFA